MTFRKVMEAWLVEGCARWTKPVQGQVCPMAWRWLDIIGGVDDGKTMTPAQVLSIAKERRKRCGPAACAREKMFLTQFLKFAEQMGCGERDGWKAVEVWKVGKVTVKKQYVALTEDQEQSLKEAAWDLDDWLGAFVEIALGTGLRCGTIRKLTPDMVKEGRILEVPGRIMKTREPVRIGISEEVEDSIRLQMKVPSTTSLRRRFTQAVKNAWVPAGMTIHDCRRTFVARMVRKGCPTPTLMKLGGWKSMSTLLKHYCTPPSDEELRKWV